MNFFYTSKTLRSQCCFVAVNIDIEFSGCFCNCWGESSISRMPGCGPNALQENWI